MAIRPDIQFGLNVNRAFADVINRDLAIENVGLRIDDLDIIRNSAAETGVSRTDLRTLAGLDFPLQRILVSLNSEVNQYSGIINSSAGTGQQLRGNLTVNGVLAASAIKYKYLEDGTNIVKNADISTSRVSSWSSPDSPTTDQSPIFYGGDLEIGGTITTNNLNLVSAALPVRFKDSEVPTHAIETTINGSTILLYAMKGIPLIIEGFFRNLNTSIELVERGAISIRIVNLDNSAFNRDFENLGGTNTLTASIIYQDTRTAQKNIEIYHNPANIRTLNLTSLNVRTLPNAELSQLQELRLYRNLLTNFIDLTKFSPVITYLDIRENAFGQSDDPSLRQFDQKITDRLPSTIRTLLMGNTFPGSITGDLVTQFPDLRSIDLDSRGAGPNFGPDALDPSGSLPAVADTVTAYTANSNSFRSMPESIKQLTNLETFSISSNSITDRDFFIDSNVIRTVNTGGRNSINVADMSGKTTLESYSSSGQNTNAYQGADTNAFTTPGGAYKFSNCVNLSSINFDGSYYRGPIPKFVGNDNLSSVNLINTQLTGGRSATEQEYVLYSDVFDDCARSLRSFRLISSSLLNKPIHPDTFANTESMDYLYIRSNRGVSGGIPELDGMPVLRYLLLLQNNLTGPLPLFALNPRIYYIHVADNKLSGSIPPINARSLAFLYLYGNQFTSFSGLETPNLRRLFVRDNLLSGDIPNLGNLTRMYDCYLNNNQFTGYTVGSFVPLTQIRRLDISNNSELTEGNVNSIIDDLYQNYQNRPRGRVSINLRNTATPTGDAVEKINFLTENRWTIRT